MALRYWLGATRRKRLDITNWLPKAASPGRIISLARFMYYLGELYEKGDDLPKDLNKAIENYRIAADDDFGPALCKLGICYLDGIGVSVNLELAEKYLEKAMKKGEFPDYESLARLWQKKSQAFKENGAANKLESEEEYWKKKSTLREKFNAKQKNRPSS